MAKIALTKVCVCGLGAVGSVLTEMLTLFGFGYGETNGITVVDMDVYDESNFARQHGARQESVGVSKALYTKILLQQLGLAEIKSVESAITPENVDSIIEDADLVLHTMDGIKGAIALVDACKRRGIPAVEGWGLSFSNAITYHPDGLSWPEVYGVTDITSGKAIADLTHDDEAQIQARFLEKFARIPELLGLYDPESVQQMMRGEVASRTSVFIWGASHQVFAEAVKNVLGIGTQARAPAMVIYDPFTQKSFLYDLQKEQVVEVR